jgi:hypothetical protein
MCAVCGFGDASTAGSVACWPGLLSVTAFNPPPVTPGFSAGDVVVLSFSSPTNSSAAVVFTPPIGVTSASWRAGNRELWVTVVSVSGVNTSAVNVASGLLSVLVSNVFNADGRSLPSVAVSRTVTGNWGLPAPPIIVDISAVDGGRNVGPGTNDTLVVTFDQAVRQVDVHSAGLLTALLSFEPPLPSDVDVVGTWTSPLLLTVTLTVPGGELPNWTRWNVGVLTVFIRLSANLTSASGESGSSNSSAVVRGGSWGDAPTLMVSPKNATAVVAIVRLPTTLVGYSVFYCVVQWSTDASFVGDHDVPGTVAGVQDWVQTGAPTTPGVDDSGREVASAVIVSDGTAGSAIHAAVVRLIVPSASIRSPLRFDVPRLSTSTAHSFRGACNGFDGAMGPVVPSNPPSVTPQSPSITFVYSPSAGLPTAGGAVMEVVGEQVGGIGSSVFIVLSRTNVGTFRTSDCDIRIPSSRIRCVSPPGVGTGLALRLMVDGMASPPFVNGTISYAAPAITALRVISGGSDHEGGGVPTTGGGVVVVEGVNFGPADLGFWSLGAVTYSPAALAVSLRAQLSFPAIDCVITRDHTELTCGMGPGVGGGLLWSVTIAGQSASTATTTYRPPAIATVGIATPAGTVLSDPSSLRALVTQGGQQLVRACALLLLYVGLQPERCRASQC